MLELTLESRWRSLLFLLAPCLCLVLAAALEDWVRVRPRGCGDPVGEFFSRLLRVSSRRLVCGVRPAPVPELKQALIKTWSEVPGFYLTWQARLPPWTRGLATARSCRSPWRPWC